DRSLISMEVIAMIVTFHTGEISVGQSGGHNRMIRDTTSMAIATPMETPRAFARFSMLSWKPLVSLSMFSLKTVIHDGEEEKEGARGLPGPSSGTCVAYASAPGGRSLSSQFLFFLLRHCCNSSLSLA